MDHNDSYKIKELSDILNISKQMIRYYEQCGVINPEREKDNNYRIYHSMDLFELLEAVSLSKFDVNIKKIHEIKNTQAGEMLKESYQSFYEKKQEEIAFDQMICERSKEMIDIIETAQFNIGNIYVKKMPEAMRLHWFYGKDDHYTKMMVPNKLLSFISSQRMIPFVDNVILFEPEKETWFVQFQKRYIKESLIPSKESWLHEEEQLVLATIIDMGDKGAFRDEQVFTTAKKMREKGYDLEPYIYGRLLYRGVENDSYHRYLELFIPLKH
jgi:DNA-binding transcriptional MerR regulator